MKATDKVAIDSSEEKQDICRALLGLKRLSDW